MSEPTEEAHEAGAAIPERRARSETQSRGGDRPKRLRNLALVGGLGLLGLSVTLGLLDGRANAREELDQQLDRAATDVQSDIQNYFERARALNLLLARNPAFANFYREPGSREEKIRNGSVSVREANNALAYIEDLYPGRIGEACFIDRSGSENARVVDGTPAPIEELSPDEDEADFFAPTFALEPGQVYQAKPYISPDTNELVISNSTLVPFETGKPAIVHFEVTVESFRREIADNGAWMRIVDSGTGEVVADSRFEHVAKRPDQVSADMSLTMLAATPAASGALDVGSDRVAFVRVGEDAANANRWVVAATAPRAGFDVAGLLTGWPAAMMVGALGMLALAGLGFRSYQRELKKQALTDELTGLPNRALFRDRIDRALGLNRRDGGRAAVMIVDVNRFKDVNDTLGHHHGDLLLAEVASRLSDSVRDSDTVARLGGDEFGILLPRIESPRDVELIADRVVRSLAEPILLEGVPVQIDVSQGAALAPDHAEQLDELVQRADVAMYTAKSRHDGFRLYETAHDTFNPRRLAMVPELRAAIEGRQLTLNYQPKVIMDSGIVEGVEALARWEHATMGQVTPDEFIRLAEDTGLIRSLTVTIMELAVAEAARWRERGQGLRVSVNISARNLVEPGFPAQVADCLARHSLPASLLQLEITETMLMSDTDAAIATIDRLHALGVALSIDDFGTGYSSLTYLKRLPVGELKIDKSFVFEMTTNEADASIVRSTIALAKNLGLKVVAEGVETMEVLAALTDLGCDVAQGFVIAVPMAAQELQTWLDAHRIADEPQADGGSSPASSQPRFRWAPGSGGIAPAAT